jgi:hypothetical protein
MHALAATIRKVALFGDRGAPPPDRRNPMPATLMPQDNVQHICLKCREPVVQSQDKPGIAYFGNSVFKCGACGETTLVSVFDT